MRLVDATRGIVTAANLARGVRTAVRRHLRPACKHCNRALPADTADAWICSYECDFCGDCVENVPKNVCPDCGGGFMPRPVDRAALEKFAAPIRSIPPERR